MTEKEIQFNEDAPAQDADVICISRSRWNSLDENQRHRLSGCAGEGRRVFFVEAPMFDVEVVACIDLLPHETMCVAVPHLPRRLAGSAQADDVLQGLLDELAATAKIQDYVLCHDTSAPAKRAAAGA